MRKDLKLLCDYIYIAQGKFKEQIYSEAATEYCVVNSNEIIKENKLCNYIWFNYTYY